MAKRMVLLVGVLAVVAALVAVAVWILSREEPATVARPSAGCGKAPPAVSGETEVLSLVVDGLEREYRLHLPADYDKETPTSLVLAFHWYGGKAQHLETVTKMSLHADEQGYIAVYPESTSFDTPLLGTITSWNDLSCNASSGPEGPTCSDKLRWPFPPECGEPRDCTWCTCNDDVGFVDRLLDELQASLCIDLDRVYATGISSGGMFVHRLGCDLPERFAAIAPVAGTLSKGFNCAPGRQTPISIMHLHGSDDAQVPPDGSEGTEGQYFVPVADVIDAWAGAASQGCDAAETPYPTSAHGAQELHCTQRANCAAAAEVVSCTWAGNHMSSLLIFEPYGNDVIWEFFSKNSKQ